MKRIYNTIAFFFLTLGFVNATPALTKFQVESAFLQGNKIKVYNGGPTEFTAAIGGSRGVSGSTYEPIEMEVVFYIYSYSDYKDHHLKTIKLTSDLFEYAYLKYYNEVPGQPAAMNNMVTISIPENINKGNVLVKYRWKDANGKWQPSNDTSGGYTLVSASYETLSPPPPPPVEIVDLVTYPSKSQPLIGVKLPGETLEAKWNPAKITSSLVDVSIYAGATLIVKKSSIPNNGSTVFDFSSVTMDNTNDANRLTFNFSNPVNGLFYSSGYRIVIKEVGGNKYGESGLFCFVNDHPMLWITQFPQDFIGVFPNSFWIFRTITNSGDGELYVDWLVDRINATNVTIDLYDANGGFVKKLTTSTSNNGHYTRPPDASIPRGNPYYYQFKITSIENPSQVGYSEVFHHFID